VGIGASTGLGKPGALASFSWVGVRPPHGRYVGNWGYYRQGDHAPDYVRARWYGQTRGRWLSRDPFVADAPYLYSASWQEARWDYLSGDAPIRNRPTSGADPAGLFALEVAPGYTPKLLTKCGAASAGVNWVFSGKPDGLVIQHVLINCEKWVPPTNCTPPFQEQCTDEAPCQYSPRWAEFWEAWVVKNGVVYNAFWENNRIVIQKTDPPHDLFEIADEAFPRGSRGTNSTIAKVAFFPNRKLSRPPWKFEGDPGHVKWAGTLPTMESTPPGYSEAGALRHELVVTWHCCPTKTEPVWSHIP
jgi:hypothetical protein